MAAGDFDDAVCCIENTVENRIMDSGASFHATYCKEELHRFRLRSGKVRLADDKTLDIAGVGDVVLKTSFGTSWTLKDVRYILGLKRMLVSVGQLDEKGYHVGFGDQQWKVTTSSLVVTHGNKRGSLYMVEAHPEGIGAIINGSGSAAVWFGEAEESFLHNIKEDKETTEVGATGVAFGVAERLSRTFRAESTGLRAEALKMLWADSVSTTYLIYRIPYVPIGLRIPEEEWRGKDTSLAHLKVIRSRDITFMDLIYEARSATNSSSLTKPIHKSQVVLVDIPENLAENDSIVAEHGLSSEITQSPCGSSNTSERSENNRSFEDSKRSDEEYSEDGASTKEGGSETPHVRRSTRESRAPVRYSPSANYLLLIENGEPESYSKALSCKESVQWKKAIIEEMVSLEKNQTCSLVGILAGKKASQRLWMFKVKEEQNGSKRCKARLEPSYVGALNDTSTQHKSEGFQLAGHEENLECRLKEIMYGLIQAPRLRYLKFDSFMQKDKMKDRCSEKQVLGYVLTVGITTIEWESGLQKSITMIPRIESLLTLRLVGATSSVCLAVQKGATYRTERLLLIEREIDDTHAVKRYTAYITIDLDALCTPESFVTHSNFDTPGGTVYYIPKVSAAVLLVKGNVYDSVMDCVVAIYQVCWQKQVVLGRSCQKRMLNGDVRQKYLVCNRMGCPKGIHVDTLDLGNSDKQKRNSNLHITGCKARAVFNLDTCTRKFVLKVFDTIHNHELEREEYKHLSKTERQLTYMEQAFIVKAASVNIGATRAHHLLTGIKGSYLLVHGTTVDFKNFFRSVNCYIGDSDAQMLIHKMENRKKHVSDFSFDYLVDNAELTAIFWADEVSKYNYREFGDVVSFDATFKTNKYKMVFVPFTAIDNHRKCVTVAAGFDRLMNLLNCIETAMEKQRHVTRKDGSKTIDTVPKLRPF
ncbi:retrovirus-related pol polyprotein from transposon TNT 1-94 [Tanacetum coccineum]